MNLRQQEQKTFDESVKNIIVGEEQACPLSVEQLAATTSESPYVVETFDSGLTAEVFHLSINGQDFTLKKKRPVAKVQNLDGQYSFLNEVQRRQDFTRLKNSEEHAEAFKHIVSTIYANYRLGIILSPWIEGEPVTDLTGDIIEQLFSTLLASEQAGLFEWDLCSGNLLIDKNNQLTLFDFGYMYPFNPLTDLNSNGLDDSIFHLSERFETRFLFGWFLHHNIEKSRQLEIYQQVKACGLSVYSEKLEWLNLHAAEQEVLNHTAMLSLQCKERVSNETQLKRGFLFDSFRSHVLDIEDDLHGKSCTPVTIKRIDAVDAMLKSNFEQLESNDMLFYGNSGKSKQALLEDYKVKRTLAESYLL